MIPRTPTSISPGNTSIHAKDTWLGPKQDLGAIGSTYNLTMDPFEKYDMTFNGAVSTRMPTTSPGRYAGYDNGWVLSLITLPIMEFDKSIVDFPNIKRFPGGASNDMSSESSGSGKSVAFDGYPQTREDHRRRRLIT